MPSRKSSFGANGPLTAIVLACAVGWLGQAPCAAADGLKTFFTDLYGPEGFILAPTPPPFPSHLPHFSASSLQELDALNTAIAGAVSTLSPSVSVGRFSFDVERGVPLPTTENLGPLLAERAETIGKGRFDFAATYTRIHYTRFEGTPLTDLTLDFHHQDVNNDGVLGGGVFDFEKDVVRVHLSTTINQEILAFFGTYGITDKWDVGVIVPVEHIFMGVTADATIIRNSAVSAQVHNFGPNGSPPHQTVTDDATGLGDIFVRTKYNFLKNDSKYPDLAVVGRVRLPTGDDNNLLGTGYTSAAALLVASKTFGTITPHLNIGYEVPSGHSKENSMQYVVGMDTRLGTRLSAAFEILGLWKPQGNGIGDNLVDFAVGAKWNPFGKFLVSANLLVPINKNDGLRPNYIWTLGAEYNF